MCVPLREWACLENGLYLKLVHEIKPLEYRNFFGILWYYLIVDPIFGMARLNKMDGLYHQPVGQFAFVPVFKLRLMSEVKFHVYCNKETLSCWSIRPTQVNGSVVLVDV